MCDQLDEIVETSEDMELANEDGTDVECPEADKDDLLKYYKHFLKNGCLPRFSEYMGVDLDGNLIGDRQLNNLPYLDYLNVDKRDNGELIDHRRKETDDYYFCKYGIAYAFEYAMLYDIMLRIHNANRFGVYSFGCGGFIDAWSLLYARANLQEQGDCQDLELFYQGIDITRWPTAVFGELIDDKWPTEILDEPVDEMGNGNNENWLKGFHITYHGVDRDIERSISKFLFKKPEWGGVQQFRPRNDSNYTKMDYNVLMFSKLLNVLPSDVLDKFIEKLNRFEYEHKKKQRDYYICVSHSPARLREGTAAVEKIVDMFIEKGFEYQDNLTEMFDDEEQYNDICRQYKIETREREDESDYTSKYKCYIVGGKKTADGQDKPPVYIKDHLARTFECREVGAFLKKLSTKLQDENMPCRCIQMGTADIAFQIIKLTKRREE